MTWLWNVKEKTNTSVVPMSSGNGKLLMYYTIPQCVSIFHFFYQKKNPNLPSTKLFKFVIWLLKLGRGKFLFNPRTASSNNPIDNSLTTTHKCSASFDDLYKQYIKIEINTEFPPNIHING